MAHAKRDGLRVTIVQDSKTGTVRDVSASAERDDDMSGPRDDGRRGDRHDNMGGGDAPHDGISGHFRQSVHEAPLMTADAGT